MNEDLGGKWIKSGSSRFSLGAGELGKRHEKNADDAQCQEMKETEGTED